MPETRIWIAQCLCPQRHCILAAAGDAGTEVEAQDKILQPLRQGVAKAIESRLIDPWCGLCFAEAETWKYEVGRTRFRTMAEAEPALKQLEREQIAAAAAGRMAGGKGGRA